MLSVGLEPDFFNFRILQVTGASCAHGTSIYGGRKISSHLIIFVCTRLDEVIMEKHRLWPSEWEFHMEMFTFPCENALRKNLFIYFDFSVSLCDPLLTPALKGLHDHCWPWQLCLCSFLTFSTLSITRSHFSGEWNVTCSSKQSLLRLERVVIIENGTIVWIFSNLWGIFAFSRKKKKKREWKSLIFSPQWSFHFEHVFIWILIQKQSAVSLNQVIPNSEAPVNHSELNPRRFSQPCHRGWGTLLHSSCCLWT